MFIKPELCLHAGQKLFSTRLKLPGIFWSHLEKPLFASLPAGLEIPWGNFLPFGLQGTALQGKRAGSVGVGNCGFVQRGFGSRNFGKRILGFFLKFCASSAGLQHQIHDGMGTPRSSGSLGRTCSALGKCFLRICFPGPLFQDPFARIPFPGSLFQDTFLRIPFPGSLSHNLFATIHLP